jgi:phosphate acetyltransferase
MIFQDLPQDIQENILIRAKNKKCALPEGNDPRVQQAAQILSSQFQVNCILGDGNPNSIFDAGIQLAQDQIDAVVAGCVLTTADVIRAAIKTVGMKPQVKKVTSCFLLALNQPTAGGQKLVVYADCAVLPEPTSEDLANIAFVSQEAFSFWTNQTPFVSFLSFSTSGSSKHEDVIKVQQAYELFSKQHPDILAEGEIQFDAAVVPEISKRKNPKTKICGRTNVFVFPDLNAANIGYKITQQIGLAKAWGPVLLGCAKPFSDLSRGATSDDIVHTCLLTLALNKTP